MTTSSTKFRANLLALSASIRKKAAMVLTRMWTNHCLRHMMMLKKDKETRVHKEHKLSSRAMIRTEIV